MYAILWNELTLRDPVSAGTHFVAFAGAIFGTAVLWRLSRDDRLKQLSMGIFGASMCALYLASATYHALRLPPQELRFYQLLDHSAIYGLIAGTYTPILFNLTRGWPRTVLLTALWGVAAVGIVCKWTLPPTAYPLTIGLYLGMGWIGMLSAVPVIRAIGGKGMAWAALGGLFYTAGALCELTGWPVLEPNHFRTHELFHVAVVLGTLSHFLLILRFVVPYPRRRTVLERQIVPQHCPYAPRRRAA
jgi:hemolysin III